jgi:hypothetical protein
MQVSTPGDVTVQPFVPEAVMAVVSKDGGVGLPSLIVTWVCNPVTLAWDVLDTVKVHPSSDPELTVVCTGGDDVGTW